MNRLLPVLFTLATILFVGLITPGLAADQIDGKYYAEDINEDDLVWMLYLEVANNEVFARITYEGCGLCSNTSSKFYKEGDKECGSTKLDTEGEFELWCVGQKLSGNLREASLWRWNISHVSSTGGAEFKIISHSELAKFNRFKEDTGIHKTSAYLDEKLKSEKK